MAPALGPIWAWTSRPVRGNPRRPTTGGQHNATMCLSHGSDYLSNEAT